MIAHTADNKAARSQPAPAKSGKATESWFEMLTAASRAAPCRDIGAKRVVFMVHLEPHALVHPPRSRVVVLHIQHGCGDAALAQPLQACKRDLRPDGL